MMNSSPVLRQQSQNKIQSDHSRTRKEVSKMPGDPTVSRHLSVPHPSKHGVENQDPAGSHALKAPVKPAMSRLPVLAKSLRLQAPSDFTQSHKRWEDNPLAGKSKRKKPCTKPIPFNLSQSNRTVTQSHRPPLVATSRAGPQVKQPEKTGRAAHLKTTEQPQPKSSVERPAVQHSAAPKPGPFILAQLNRGQTQGGERRQIPLAATSLSPKPKAPSTASAALESGPPGCFRVPASFTPSSAASALSSGQNKDLSRAAASAPPALSTESCLSHLHMLSLKDRCKTSLTVQPGQRPASVQLSSGVAGSGEAFCPDPGALRSILQNQGVSAAGAPGSKTPLAARSSTQAYSYVPQRVSIMSRHKAGPPTGPSTESILGSEEGKAEGLLRATPRNTCPTARGSSIYTPRRVPVSKSLREATTGPVGSGEAFCPDPGALRSILQNEGVSAAGAPGSKTPLAAGSSTQAYSYVPQRVSIMKSHQKAGPPTGPSTESILGSEEGKAEGLLRATPRNTCPTARGSSIYTAQRVPVTKNRSEATAGPLDLLKGTPGRVPNTRNQPMSLRRLMSAHRTPYAGSPKLRGLGGHNSTEMEAHKEEVIQRLFMETDQEEEEEPTKNDEITEPTEFLHSETKWPNWSLEAEEAEESASGRQPFFQAPQRESVIFFSTGKKLVRAAPAREPEGGGGEPEQRGGGASSTQGPPPVHPGGHPGPHTPSVPSSLWDATRQNSPSILSQLRGVVQKGGALSSVTALLRRRLPPLEDLRLDEEVATYTLAVVPPSSSSSPCSLRPRCGNPVASLLRFQEGTSFLPIMDDLPTSGPTSSNPPPLRKR